MVREGALHLRPKRGAVIKLGQVAQLVDDDVVAQLLRQERHFVIKVEVAARRAGAPARPGVADKNFIVAVTVQLVVVAQTRVHHHPRRLAVLGVMPLCPPPHAVSAKVRSPFQKRCGSRQTAQTTGPISRAQWWR